MGCFGVGADFYFLIVCHGGANSSIDLFRFRWLWDVDRDHAHATTKVVQPKDKPSPGSFTGSIETE